MLHNLHKLMVMVITEYTKNARYIGTNLGKAIELAPESVGTLIISGNHATTEARH